MNRFTTGLLTAAAFAVCALPGWSKSQAPNAQAIYSKSCAGCHGAKLQGAIGPPLTHIGKKRSAAWIDEKIENPKKTKPNTLMPPASVLKLNNGEVKALAAFLSHKK